MLRPITCGGRANSTRGSFEALRKSASIAMVMPGQIAPPRYSPLADHGVEGGGGAEVDHDQRAVVLSKAATALTIRSAPTSRGLS